MTSIYTTIPPEQRAGCFLPCFLFLRHCPYSFFSVGLLSVGQIHILAHVQLSRIFGTRNPRLLFVCVCVCVRVCDLYLRRKVFSSAGEGKNNEGLGSLCYISLFGNGAISLFSSLLYTDTRVQLPQFYSFLLCSPLDLSLGGR